MAADHSVRFFDAQFQQQARAGDFQLNPFEQAALPYLRGRVLDLGCGMGNLAFAAAKRGRSVLALDASSAAIEHIRRRAAEEGLAVEGALADLRDYRIAGEFDAIVCIGLLMFFDCPAAFRVLADIRAHVRKGGVAIVNVLIEGTTYMDMFDPAGHCLFAPDELEHRFADWEILAAERREFPAPGERVKAFSTVIARRPEAA